MTSSFNHFGDLAAALRPALSQVVEKTALDIQADAASRAPVRTGFLRNSIHMEPGENDLTAYVVVGASYGIYLEYGTHRMAAQPYLTPAMEHARSSFEAALNAIFDRIAP